jgi:hypothetical protein
MSICTIKLLIASTQDADIWMKIPIQQDVYIWASYSVSSTPLF